MCCQLTVRVHKDSVLTNENQIAPCPFLCLNVNSLGRRTKALSEGNLHKKRQAPDLHCRDPPVSCWACRSIMAQPEFCKQRGSVMQTVAGQ